MNANPNLIHETNGRIGAPPALPPRLVRYGGTAPNPSAQADAHYTRGTELATQGRRDEAIPELRQAIRLAPDHPRAHFNLGVALGIDKRHAEALESFRAAIRCQPDFVDAHYGMGNALIELDRIEEAVVAFQRAVFKKPDYVDALNNLAMALTRLGRGGPAEVFARQAVRLKADVPQNHNTLGLAYMDQGEFCQGQAAFEKALDLNPRYAEAHTNLGSAFKESGRPAEAVASYDLALALDPESVTAHWNRALALLQVGNYELGWREYEWRWKRKETPPRPFQEPPWDGSPLGGRSILLHMEQGFGDMLQFIRYVPKVKAQGGNVVVSAPPPLLGLFATCGADSVVPENQDLPVCDVHCPIMTVPGLVETTLMTIPANVPYLAADPARVERWRQRLASQSGLKVGIVWQGNPRHKLDRHRSFPLTLLEPLARIKNVSLISLQKGAGTEQIRLLGDRFPVMDVGPELVDFSDTAAVMTCLDLVICCDTAVAHLAGALGMRVWVALATVSDWRWLLGCDTTPWYPTMRLFRQERLGEWRPVFDQMAKGIVVPETKAL